MFDVLGTKHHNLKAFGFFQAKLVYTGHIYTFSTNKMDLPYAELEKWFNATQSFVVAAGCLKAMF